MLAHELGHFSQSTGMRLTYLMRAINRWFARVVYELSRWANKLGVHWSLFEAGTVVVRFMAPAEIEASLGEPCEALNDCKAGYICIDGLFVPECDDQYCCTTFCDLDASQCPQPTFCVPFFEQENPDYPTLGLCVLP